MDWLEFLTKLMKIHLEIAMVKDNFKDLFIFMRLIIIKNS